MKAPVSRGAFLLFAWKREGEKRMIGGRKLRRGLGCVLLVFFCASGAIADSLARQQSSSQQANEGAQPALAPIVVTDDVGRQVTIPQPIRRIVSIAPSATETIFALGAGDRLVGDTDYCDYPAEAKAKPKVGGVMDPNLEEVIALRPDIVVATKEGNRRETVDALERLRVPVYGLSAHSVDEVLQSIRRLADVIGASDQGKALIASLNTRLDDVRSRLANVTPTRVLFVTWREPLISIGRQTFIADVLKHAGAESVIESTQDWPHVNMEEVVHLQPDYIVFSSDDPAEGQSELAAVSDLPGWRDLKAIQDKKLAIVSEAIDRPAARLVDVIEQLARTLHPDAFATSAPVGVKAVGVQP